MAGRYPRFNDITAVYDALGRLDSATGRAPLAAIQAEAAGVAKSKVRVVLSLLGDWGVVRQHRPMAFSLLQRGLVEADLQQLSAAYDARNTRDREKLDQMIIYAQTALCRWNNLREYFGEDPGRDACGHCDNCAKAAVAPALTA
jgi:ATP-dependent DNA helicase RecQ